MNKEKFFTVAVTVSAKVLVTCWAADPDAAMIEAEKAVCLDPEQYVNERISVDCLEIHTTGGVDVNA